MAWGDASVDSIMCVCARERESGGRRAYKLHPAIALSWGDTTVDRTMCVCTRER